MSAELPLPLRAVAGLAARTLDEVRRLPERVISLPVQAVGAAMQASMRVQQEYADLVVRGDEFLLQVRGRPDDAPAWATFDDDGPVGDGTDPDPAIAMTGPRETRGRRSGLAPLLTPMGVAPSAFDLVAEPPPADRFDALIDPAEPLSDPADPLADPAAGLIDPVDGPVESTAPLDPGAERLGSAGGVAPAIARVVAPVDGYDEWTVAQLRARLSRFSDEDLAALLVHEETTRQRSPYVTMLTNRLARARRG